MSRITIFFTKTFTTATASSNTPGSSETVESVNLKRLNDDEDNVQNSNKKLNAQVC